MSFEQQNVGEGNIGYLPKSSFTAGYISDYYDGALEGLAANFNEKTIYHFKKVWWIEGSWPRVFEVSMLPVDALFFKSNSLLEVLLESYSDFTYVGKYPEMRSDYDAIISCFVDKDDTYKKYHVFCASIFEEFAYTSCSVE